MATTNCDIAVVGAGIAGASVAAELAKSASVILLEMEDQPGYHATGRSAAILAQTYGPPAIRALTRASVPFFNAPPAGFCDTPLLSSRDILLIARPEQMDGLTTAYADTQADCPLRWLDAQQVEARAPLLKKNRIAAGFVNEAAQDIDVNALHRGYLRAFNKRGGTLHCKAEVTALQQGTNGWAIQTRTDQIRAKIVVNAAGAWADQLAGLAAITPRGLTPLRRTAITVDAPNDLDLTGFPMVIDIDEQFYIKPEGGRLMASPADETPSPPGDARPEEMDVAICVDRISQAFDLPVRRIHSQWAGLRTFAADGLPVCGFDGGSPDFFWLAGQGGYGVQTAPAMAQLAADIIAARPVNAALLAAGVDPAALSPDRQSLAVSH